MNAIGKGDWVECAPPAGYRGEVSKSDVQISGRYPRRGGVYRVREIGPYLTSDGITPGIRLMGVVVAYPGHPDCWFNAKCFRPIYRERSDLIEGLLKPIPADALADVRLSGSINLNTEAGA